MSMNDPIADMLARIKNAYKVKLLTVAMPASKVLTAILQVLYDEGYVSGFRVVEDDRKHKNLEIDLKYDGHGRSVISELSRVSKPGRRIYYDVKSMPCHRNGCGVFVLSTSNGVISDREARLKNVGGEVLCKVF
ncbi:30S ribosomal protein S8 [Rickettsiales endosymbiont of Paramecium tredecaurelia]|uniref:30S ribosomal protein S8 n=1 Tax=Candidatus Sarmatiella mevalonica TaxID=2770581 RepID=UPI0019223C62|nr:30S ribosomal protein S8 [Candidatus Sarmatiella mevalonica]MBL3284565.1 30S ribosomal protein S8 [Candidatus Sarmatiella mevalonica]